KVELNIKEKPAAYYIALKLKTENYRIEQWQEDEWWIREVIIPTNITVLQKIDYKTLKKMLIR
ncbi:MAG: hypothetical protein AABX16_00960, partial [Nanoarchaeota archaeon]